MAPEAPQRPQIIGGDLGPEQPFPLRLEGPVVKGFGRGSKQLGIPTANIPIEGLNIAGRTDFDSGIYFGWAGLQASHEVHASAKDGSAPEAIVPGAAAAKDGASETAAPEATAPGAAVSEAAATEAAGVAGGSTRTYPMVMSVGWNPFYKNEKRSVEIHLLQSFGQDFYGAHIRLLVMAFIRHERDYDSLEALVADINTDIDVARRSLGREAWEKAREDEWLVGAKES